MSAGDALDRYTKGNLYPYDGDKKQKPDWAHKAARGVIADLCDRRGIKWGFNDVDEDVRVEIVESLAEIIRVAKHHPEVVPSVDELEGSVWFYSYHGYDKNFVHISWGSGSINYEPGMKLLEQISALASSKNSQVIKVHVLSLNRIDG